jgi:hypothetical protein
MLMKQHLQVECGEEGREGAKIRAGAAPHALAAADGLCARPPRQSLRHLKMWDSDGITATHSNAYWQAKSSKALRDSKWEMMSFMGGSG